MRSRFGIRQSGTVYVAGVTFVSIRLAVESDRMNKEQGLSEISDRSHSVMEVLTPKTTRRSTRIRVEIQASVISLDRMRPFAEECVVLVISALGCGFRSSQALQLETPIMLTGLPGGGSVSARVANCLALGKDGKYFLIGAALYTQGNVWNIADPPADWNAAERATSTGPSDRDPANRAPATGLTVNKKVWPYNRFSDGTESHPGRK
jgi:hypothetical protein